MRRPHLSTHLLGAVLMAMALLGLAMPVHAQAGGKNVVTTPHVRAELMAHAPEGIEPGNPVWVGLQLAHQPEWHTYWKNSGDSGLPTQLTWTLPEGVTAGEIAWPLPRKIPIGNLANYGYEGTVLLPVPLTITPQFKPSLLASDLVVKLKALWLVCRKECVPEEGDFTLAIPVRSTTALNRGAFETAWKAQPKPVLGGTRGVVPEGNVRIDGDAIQLTVQGLPVSLRGRKLDVFPETPEVIATAAAIAQEWRGAVWTATVPLSPQRSGSPGVMPFVLADGGDGYRVELQVLGQWPKVAAASGVSPALEAALRDTANPAPAPASIGFFAALLGAFLGGLILNLMPCVFPVLAIKVAGFTQHARDARRRRLGGISYAAGVVLSFLALGALVLSLRAAGDQLGWGFQLQSPAVVAALAALFTLIGLNLAGLFEFGAVLPSGVASLEARHPVANSFLSGVLAVAIASPCTAPFMGASLGLALGLPAAQALLIFAAIGVGMALPYLVACLVPAFSRALPRPGAWMDVFRKLMAFPMFGTVAWLVWVLGQQSGIDGAGALLALLVAMAMVVWALTLKGRARAVLATLAVVGLGLLAWTAGPAITRPQPAGQVASSADGWQDWQPALVDQLVASGQPVFVDFTAAWCVTCQYNKKTTLSNADVLADLAGKNVALLRADWTRRDPAITAALRQLGRSGVPVYVMYQRGRAPVVLSEILGVAEVRAVIGRL
jgi:thiol:disulfide interchange protein/DsbC/DsbD-like thiol-disulfide interchange protein